MKENTLVDHSKGRVSEDEIRSSLKMARIGEKEYDGVEEIPQMKDGRVFMGKEPRLGFWGIGKLEHQSQRYGRREKARRRR